MRRKWAWMTVALSLCVYLLLPAGSSQAAERQVRVTLPDFTVKLNGHTVDNQNREYPLLVYKDITYFPMTWYDSRLLGLEALWSPESGLDIRQSPVTSSYAPYLSEHRNASVYMAEISEEVMRINRKAIDNKQEEYPLLGFRDVMYFPLTWRFAHDEFGWDYHWNETTGLSITSHNPQVQTVDLPAEAWKNDVALFKGYYYFVEKKGTTNHVYRVPMQQSSDIEEIYSYDLQGIIPELAFQIRDDALWFTYRTQSALTGRSWHVKISEDGQTELLQTGHNYLDFRETPYGTVIVDLGAGHPKLSLQQPGQLKGEVIGDLDLMSFAEHTVSRDHLHTYGTYGGVNATIVLDEDVYVLCALPPVHNTYSIYRINLKTNKTEKIVDDFVTSFKIMDNKLYYIKAADNRLYVSALDGANEIQLSEHEVSGFASIDGKVYYTTQREANQFEVYLADPDKSDLGVWPTTVNRVLASNNRLIFQFGENSDYGAAMLSGSGDLLLQVTDPIARILTSDDGLLFQSAGDSAIRFIR